MFAIQKITRQAPQLTKLAKTQCRTIVGVPPRVKMSYAEKFIHGAALYAGIMVIPIWIACHVREYNGTAKS